MDDRQKKLKKQQSGIKRLHLYRYMHVKKGGKNNTATACGAAVWRPAVMLLSYLRTAASRAEANAARGKAENYGKSHFKKHQEDL
jgi:hypothetical protein